MVKELSDGVTETQILQKLWRNSHWKKLSMIMVWERYCNASPKPEFFLFSLFIFSFISQLIRVCLGWNFHRWFSIQKQVNWCTIDPFSLKFCTSQHSYPVPLKELIMQSFVCHTLWMELCQNLWYHKRTTLHWLCTCIDCHNFFIFLLDISRAVDQVQS